MLIDGEDDELELELPPEEEVAVVEEETEEETEEEPVDPATTQPPVEAKPEGKVLSRAEARVQKLANERKAAVEEANRVKQENAELRARHEAAERQQQLYYQQQQAYQQQQRMQQQYEQMSPQEQVHFAMQQQEQRLQQQMQQFQLQQIEANDKAAFNALKAADPRAAKLEAEVDAQLLRMRQNGMNAPRQDVYAYVLGQKLLAASKAGAGKPAKAKAAANVRRQNAPARNARGDVTTTRQRNEGFDALEERLGNIPI